ARRGRVAAVALGYSRGVGAARRSGVAAVLLRGGRDGSSLPVAPAARPASRLLRFRRCAVLGGSLRHYRLLGRLGAEVRLRYVNACDGRHRLLGVACAVLGGRLRSLLLSASPAAGTPSRPLLRLDLALSVLRRRRVA